MQIAGARCGRCSEMVVIAAEGKACARCEAVVHVDCDPAADCPVCGERFETFEPAAANAFEDAYDPREKRSGFFVGPLLFGFLGFLGALFIMYVLTLT